MATITDPAKDFADICTALESNVPNTGDTYLASKFGVSPWSREFFQVIYCIMDKADFVIRATEELMPDKEVTNDAINNILKIKLAFSRDSLLNNWNSKGNSYLNSGSVSAVRMLSGIIRPKYSYPLLNDKEIAEILSMIVELRSWLSEHQMQENDFIRQLIIDGIDNLEFRIKHMKWLGWGYAIESLREVIGAYFALERGGINPNTNPMEQAMLQKINAFVRGVYEKAKFAKDVTTTADFLVRAYGALSIAMHVGQGASGLITFSGH